MTQVSNVRTSGSRACRARARTIGVALLAILFLGASAAAADPIRGGLLYDKWWAANGSPAPAGEHPLYPATGAQSGNTTFRCKECHGWDYKGADGAYGAGSSHFTGIPGVFGSTLDAAQMFDLVRNPNGDGSAGTTVNGHGFGALGMSDADIDDVVDFLQTLVLDTDLYIDGGAQFIGDEATGGANYNGPGLCFACHGPDGTNINFGTPEAPEYVGTIAVDNPWEFLHKTRVGQPGSEPAMLSWLANGGSDQGAADIGLFAQLNLPVDDGEPGGGDPVPAASTWGLLALFLMLLGAGALIFRRAH